MVVVVQWLLHDGCCMVVFVWWLLYVGCCVMVMCGGFVW